jgi:hypothetical protein
MQIVEVQRGMATIRLSEEELVILNNALNEVCNGVDVSEFAARLGAEIADVRELLGEVSDLLNHPQIGRERSA